jgi:hypothetical protein
MRYIERGVCTPRSIRGVRYLFAIFPLSFVQTVQNGGL